MKKTFIKCSAYTDAGGREYNEDSVKCYFPEDGKICVALADGLGGHGGGDIASKIVCDTVHDGFCGKADEAQLSELLQEAHREILATKKDARSMKSTAVVLAVEGNKAVWAHVGDSRLYHFIDGELVFQTKDHSASQVAVMLGDITPDEIRFNANRNKILRSLGQDGALTVDTASKTLEKGKHAFLLCSDGFWEYVLESEMVSELRAATSPTDWIRRMHKVLSKRVDGTNDNNTAAAVWILQK